MEALVTLGAGDMRRTLNILQVKLPFDPARSTKTCRLAYSSSPLLRLCTGCHICVADEKHWRTGRQALQVAVLDEAVLMRLSCNARAGIE